METYQRIIDLLKSNNISYQEYRHEPVKTSAEAALVRQDISISQGAKALIVKFKVGGEAKFAMVVVPGDLRFDSKKVRKILGVSKLSFASVEEVAEVTNGVIPGGVPPFGNIFGIRTIVEKALLNNEKIAFNAGDRSISVVMSSEDWLKLVKPEIADITVED